MTEPARAVTASADPSLSSRLLVLSREAHARGHHEAAYHALTASMHAADDDADVRMLVVVRREAEAQIGYIDRTTPGHRLSTTSASRHAHPGVYVMLARQADMHIQMHEVREFPSIGATRHPVRPAERAPGPVDER